MGFCERAHHYTGVTLEELSEAQYHSGYKTG